jgi:hypothetical protein
MSREKQSWPTLGAVHEAVVTPIGVVFSMHTWCVAVQSVRIDVPAVPPSLALTQLTSVLPLQAVNGAGEHVPVELELSQPAAAVRTTSTPRTIA